MRKPKRRRDIFDQDTKRALRTKEFHTKSFARDWLDYTADTIMRDPLEGRRRARISVALAHRVGDRCIHVRAVSLLAHAHRALEAFQRSEAAFEVAFQLVGYCKTCLPDLYRLYTYLKHEEGSFYESLEWINRSIRMYGKNTLGLGLALQARGIIYSDNNCHTVALRDFKRALELIPPTEEDLYIAALHSYTWELAHTDDLTDIEAAGTLLEDIEERMVGVRGTVIRAKVAHLHGSVIFRRYQLDPTVEARPLRHRPKFLPCSWRLAPASTINEPRDLHLETPQDGRARTLAGTEQPETRRIPGSGVEAVDSDRLRLRITSQYSGTPAFS